MKIRRRTAATIILLTCAMTFAGTACQQNEEEKIQQEKNAYRESLQLWKRLLRKYHSPRKAAQSPEIKEVTSILELCKENYLCIDLQDQIEEAEKGDPREASENKERVKQNSHTSEAPVLSPPSDAENASDPDASQEEEQISSDPATESAASPEEPPKIPAQGMEESVFRQAFGSCFKYFSDLEVKDVGKGEILSMIKTEECRKKLPDFEGNAVLLVNGSVESIRPLSELNPVRTITYQGKEITPEQRDCLLKNYQLEKEGRTAEKASCFPGEDPYGAPAESSGQTVEIESI